MKLPQFSDTSKSFRLVLGIVAFIVAIMLAIGFGIVAVKLIINDVPYSTVILIVSQIISFPLPLRQSFGPPVSVCTTRATRGNLVETL